MHLKFNKNTEYLKRSYPEVLQLEGTDLNLSVSYNFKGILETLLKKELNIEYATCKMKNNNHKTYIPVFVLIYKHNLYISFPENTDLYRGIVKYKYSLRNLELQVDRSEPRSLNVFYVKEVIDSILIIHKGMYIDIVLFFEDSKKTLEVKKKIEDNRIIAWNTEITLITKYFDSILKNWEEDRNLKDL